MGLQYVFISEKHFNCLCFQIQVLSVIPGYFINKWVLNRVTR